MVEQYIILRNNTYTYEY